MKCVLAVLFALAAVASAQFPFAGYGYAGLGLGYRSAHIAAPLAVAPIAAVPSGYVAATRGAVHTAPLPQGPFAFSHHINTAPAPGTFY